MKGKFLIKLIKLIYFQISSAKSIFSSGSLSIRHHFTSKENKV